MAIKLPKQFTAGYSTSKKPTVPVEIDWDNPLTKGLINYLDLGNPTCHNIVDNNTFGNGTVYGTTSEKSGLRFSSSLDYIDFGNKTLPEEFTLYFDFNDLTGTEPSYQYFFSSGDYGVANSIHCYYDDSDVGQIYIRVAGGYYRMTTLETNIAYIVTPTSVQIISLDHKLLNETISYTPTNHALRIGGRTDGNIGRFYDGVIHSVYMFNKAHSIEEARKLLANPYQILKPAIPQYAIFELEVQQSVYPLALPKEFTVGFSTNKKPTCPVEIDWDSPYVNNNLVYANIGGYDHVNKIVTPYYEEVDNGIVWNFDSTVTYPYNPLRSGNHFRGILRAKMPPLDGVFRAFFFIGHYNNSTDNSGIWINKNTSDKIEIIVRNNGVNSSAYLSTVFTEGETLNIRWAWVEGSQGHLNVNGIAHDNDNGNGFNCLFIASPSVRMGRNSIGSEAGVEFSYVYKTLNDRDVLEELQLNPYKIFKPQIETLFFPAIQDAVQQSVYPLALPKEFTAGFSGNKQPTVDVEIDWNHPLAKGLTICIIGSRNKELVHGFNLKPLNGAKFTVASGEQVIDTSATLSAIEVEGSGGLNIPVGSDFSSFSKFQMLSVNPTGTIIGKRASSCNFQIYIGSDQLSVRIGDVFDTYGDTLIENTWVTAGVVYDSSGATCTAYIDGKFAQTQTGQGVPAQNVSEPISLGARWDTYPTPTYDGDFYIPITMLWNDRKLTAEETKSLNDNPYQILKPVIPQYAIFESAIGSQAVNDAFEIAWDTQLVGNVLTNDTTNCA